MSSFPFAPLLALAVATSVRADAPSPLANAESPAPAATSSAPERSHALSPATSARVVTTLPKFTARTSPSETSASPAADRRDTDKPRNTIIRLPRALLPPSADSSRRDSAATDDPPPDGVTRLPKYEVRDRKYPALKNRELLTPEAKVDLQFKKHPALKIGNLFGLNRGIAFLMAEEDDAYERRQEMTELLDLQAFANEHPARDPDAPAPAATPAAVKTK